MPRCTTLRFTDPAAYQAAIRPARVELCLTERGEFRAELTQIELGRLWMEAGCENLPRISNNLTSFEQPAILFLADAAQPDFRYGGMDVSANAIVVNTAGAIHHLRTSGPFRWASMALRPDDLASSSKALFDRALSVPPLTYIAHPEPGHMRRLVRLHATAVRLARSASETLTHPQLARSLEEALVRAMLGCLVDGSQAKIGRRVHHHTRILARLEEFLAANCNRPLYLSEICAAIGASERTLRVCCEEHLGMGPAHYLWLRRMYLARRALALADPATATVTQIATSYGFWELGRFAVSYRKLFGETPSASLRRAARGRLAPDNRPSDFADLNWT